MSEPCPSGINLEVFAYCLIPGRRGHGEIHSHRAADGLHLVVFCVQPEAHTIAGQKGGSIVQGDRDERIARQQLHRGNGVVEAGDVLAFRVGKRHLRRNRPRALGVIGQRQGHRLRYRLVLLGGHGRFPVAHMQGKARHTVVPHRRAGSHRHRHRFAGKVAILIQCQRRLRGAGLNLKAASILDCMDVSLVFGPFHQFADQIVCTHAGGGKGHLVAVVGHDAGLARPFPYGDQALQRLDLIALIGNKKCFLVTILADLFTFIKIKGDVDDRRPHRHALGRGRIIVRGNVRALRVLHRIFKGNIPDSVLIGRKGGAEPILRIALQRDRMLCPVVSVGADRLHLFDGVPRLQRIRRQRGDRKRLEYLALVRADRQAQRRLGFFDVLQRVGVIFVQSVTAFILQAQRVGAGQGGSMRDCIIEPGSGFACSLPLVGVFNVAGQQIIAAVYAIDLIDDDFCLVRQNADGIHRDVYRDLGLMPNGEVSGCNLRWITIHRLAARIHNLRRGVDLAPPFFLDVLGDVKLYGIAILRSRKGLFLR